MEAQFEDNQDEYCSFVSSSSNWEVLQGDKSNGVKGRLKKSFNYWESTISASRFVLDIISEGYKLPFVNFPGRCYLNNNLSARNHPEFVQQAILELLSRDCIEEHSEPPFCVNPLTVAQGKKLRLVLDLRHVNSFLRKQTFKYEDLRSLSKMFEQNVWFFTWDLESGYHHVDIFPEHRKYLGFAWPFDGNMRFFSFKVLPFGLSSACFCFTKLLRPLVKRWRSMGHNSFVYLDDGCCGQPDKISASAASTIQQKDLLHCGLKINLAKSSLDPMQVGEWLGFIIDTIRMEFRIPTKKLSKIKEQLAGVLASGNATFRQLSRIAGFMNSLSLSLGPIARLFTRQIHSTLQSRSFWDHSIVLSPPLIEELRFWFNNIDAYNGFSIQPKFTPGAVIFVMPVITVLEDFVFILTVSLFVACLTPMKLVRVLLSESSRLYIMFSRLTFPLLGTKRSRFSVTIRTRQELCYLAAQSNICNLWP